MDIAFAFDERYVNHARVAMESILDCHPDRDDLTFWLLTTSQVVAERSEALHRQVRRRAGVEFLTADEAFRSLPGSQGIWRRYLTTGIYLRLFLPQLLPARVGRLLYLDCDVLVNGDLGPLWELPLGDAALAAVRDSLVRSMDYEGGVPGAGPQIRAGAAYFNSGVMMMNLPVWRRLQITERCLDYLAEHRDRLRFPDQDALNLVCYQRWLRLKSIWNDTVLWWLKADDHVNVRRSVRISHFAGPNKPWQSEFRFTGYRQRYCELATRIPGLDVDAAETAMPAECTVDQDWLRNLLPAAPWSVAAPPNRTGSTVADTGD